MSQDSRKHDVDQINAPPLWKLLTSNGVKSDKKNIDQLLLETVDEILADLLGRSVRENFYDLMERDYYVSRDEIPRRLNDFLLVLERNFGKGGKTIERSIARRLCTKLNS